MSAASRDPGPPQPRASPDRRVKVSPALRVGCCVSLSGRYAGFGTQVAHALHVWCALDGRVEVVLRDDRSDPSRVPATLATLAGECDLLLGPYSTGLMRAAAAAAGEVDRLLWNHGGAGDDVQAACPGRIVSVLSPAGTYAQPFLELIAGEPVRAPLWIVRGRGGFARQVASGAEAIGRRLGLDIRSTDVGGLAGDDRPAVWDMCSAGAFEEDAATVVRALRLPRRPRRLASVAAGVGEFARYYDGAPHVYGLAQWSPGNGASPRLGPSEARFLDAYTDATGVRPDYPAVQAVAAAVIASHCARAAEDVTVGALWRAAASLTTTTLYGDFRLDVTTGAQVGHRPALVLWTPGGAVKVPAEG